MIPAPLIHMLFTSLVLYVLEQFHPLRGSNLSKLYLFAIGDGCV